MATVFEIDVKANVPKSLTNRLDKLSSGQLVRRILDDVAASVLRRNQRRFLDGVTPEEQAWPISSGAIRRAAGQKDAQGIDKIGSKGNTLFSTGSLFLSIQLLREKSTTNQRVVGVNPLFSNRVSGDSVASYARVHQFGEGRIPQREFLGIGTGDQAVINAIAKKKVKDLVEGK